MRSFKEPDSRTGWGPMHIVYSRHYDISCFGIERLHPFDSKKYGRAWRVLRRQFGSLLLENHIPVDRPVSDEELSLVHSTKYLTSLRSPTHIAAALEVPLLRVITMPNQTTAKASASSRTSL